MFIVPIKGDVIQTVDDGEFTVAAYSNFKSKGPCIYAQSDTDNSSSNVPIYFFDIKQLNGIKIEFNNASKILNALGFFKRKQHLPQKHDTIFVDDEDSEEEEVKQKKVKVKELKLHNRNLGLSKGLLVIGEDDQPYSLSSINKIKRFSGDSFFDKAKFQKLYSDYLGYNGKSKK